MVKPTVQLHHKSGCLLLLSFILYGKKMGKTWQYRASPHLCTIFEFTLFFFLKKLEDVSVFVGLSAPLFWTFGDVYPGFQSQVDVSLACFVTYIQLIPQVHLWCDTCWPLDSQQCTRDLFIHILDSETITNHILLLISISFRYREDLYTIYIQTILTNILSPLYLVNLTKNAHMNTKQNIGVGTCLTGILNLFQVSFSFLVFYKFKNQRLVSDILYHAY